jgi:hypothetical protein
MVYRRQADKPLQQGGQAEGKQLLFTLVGEVKLMPRTWPAVAARGNYEEIGCGGLQRPERIPVAFPLGIESDGLRDFCPVRTRRKATLGLAERALPRIDVISAN